MQSHSRAKSDVPPAPPPPFRSPQRAGSLQKGSGSGARLESFKDLSQHRKGLFRKKVTIANMLQWTKVRHHHLPPFLTSLSFSVPHFPAMNPRMLTLSFPGMCRSIPTLMHCCLHSIPLQYSMFPFHSTSLCLPPGTHQASDDPHT